MSMREFDVTSVIPVAGSLAHFVASSTPSAATAHELLNFLRRIHQSYVLSVSSVSSVVNPTGFFSTQFIQLGGHKSLHHFLEGNSILPA